MDEKSLEEAMERLLTSPKEVEVDGQRVTNQSVGDLIKVANYLGATTCPASRATARASMTKWKARFTIPSAPGMTSAPVLCSTSRLTS